MMEGPAGSGQAPDRRTRRAAPRGQPLPPRRVAHRIGGPSGLPPVRGASAAVRAGNRAAGPVVRSGRGLGRPGAGSEPPSMDFWQLGCVLLWIRRALVAASLTRRPGERLVSSPALLRCRQSIGLDSVVARAGNRRVGVRSVEARHEQLLRRMDEWMHSCVVN